MKKICVALALVLSLCLIFAGCDLEDEAETVSVSGDLAYYAEMDENTREEKCDGKYIEVTGEVDIVFANIGTIYIGDSYNDGVRFSCDLSNADDAKNVQAGDIITIQGKCSNCLGSSIYLKKCKIVTPSTEATASTSGYSNTDSEPDTATEPAHIHNFAPATCTTPKTCACGATEGSITDHNWIAATCTKAKTCSGCGATEGSAAGHNWQSATCTAPKTCSKCNATDGQAKGHSYYNSKCTVCGASDPNDPLVWIPTNGGTKYHSKSSCSGMKNPVQVPKSQAIARGFGRCGRCH